MCSRGTRLRTGCETGAGIDDLLHQPLPSLPKFDCEIDMDFPN